MKSIMFVLLTFFVGLVYAQDIAVQKDNTLKPGKGNFVTELNFNPFQGNLSLNNSINQIKGRYYIDDKLVLRLGLGLSVVDSAISYGNPYGAESYYNSNNRKSTAIDINIGLEKHFKGTGRLSPYIGIDLSYGTKSASQNIVTTPYEMDIKNGWMELIYFQSGSGFYSSTQIVANAYNRFGAFAVAGFDFYMAKNFFVGYEFNLGYFKTNFKSPDITVTGQNPGYSSYVSENKSTTFKSSLINGIRVGYAF